MSSLRENIGCVFFTRGRNRLSSHEFVRSASCQIGPKEGSHCSSAAALLNALALPVFGLPVFGLPVSGLPVCKLACITLHS